MSDAFYRVVRFVGRHAFWVSSRPVVRGVEHIPRSGPFLLASTHTSPFDVALLIRHSPRLLDFVSIVEVFKNPFLAWFYGSMNAFPLDRYRPDAATVRVILNRLERGRPVAMFPEGGFKRGEHSVVHSGKIKRGVGAIAHLANVPVIPAVIINSIAYSRPLAWAPWRPTRYAIAFGPPIAPAEDADSVERQLVSTLQSLHREIAPLLPESCRVM